MRVALISREHAGRVGTGGIGTYTVTTGRALARAGHDVVLLTEGPADGDGDGVRVVSLPPRDAIVPGAARLAARRRIARVTRDLGVDVAQASEWQAEAWWLARTHDVPLVTRLATPTYLVDAFNLQARNGRGGLLRRMERDQALRSDRLIAPSRAIADRVGRDWGIERHRIDVIPNPLELASIRAAGASEPGVPLPERYLVFIGRLEPRKGIHVLAEALPRVLDAHPGLHVVFVGRDRGGAEQVNRHASRFADRLHFVGELPRDRALAVVARAELAVLPSLWEAFGFVAAEAMALGRPVVASDGSGFAEIVEHDRSGWLVPPGDVDALARTLSGRLGDERELARVSAGALTRAEDFDADRLMPRLLENYEQAIATRRPRRRIGSDVYTRDYRRFFRPEDRRTPFHAIYERKRRAVLAFFSSRPRMRLLDVGCGPGRFVAPLAAHHAMTGCDLSEDMLEEARRNAPADVRLVQADARSLPFGDGEFDGLLALDLLTHLPEPAAAIRELARVVRPGGMLVFDSSNASPWWVLAYPSYVSWRPHRLVATMRRQGVLPEWVDLVRHHRADEIRAAIAGCGLRLDRMQPFGPRWSPKWHLWYVTKEAG
jgi:glycogen synthase